MFLSLRRNTDPESIGLDDDAELVTLNVLNNPDIEYFNIKVLNNNVTLTPVNIKSGPRSNGTPTEVVEIEAGNEVVGSAEIPS